MKCYSSTKAVLRDYPQTIIGISFLIVLLMPLASCSSSIDENSSPVSTNYENQYIPFTDLGDASPYWNTAWSGCSSELYNEITAFTTNYFQTHKYVFGESDCNDMAVDVWQKLVDRDITSLIVVDNLEKSHDTFLECNHAWLMVYSGEGSSAAIDLVLGKVFTWEDVRTNPQLRQYWEGFVYESPSDLLGDFKERW